MIDDAARGPCAGWLLLLASLGAAWMNLGRLHDSQNADSILTILVSLQHWTPFLWGQDRFGMLVPLLAVGFHDPLANMLVQGWFTCFAALLAPFLVSWSLPANRNWFAAGVMANVFLILFLAPTFQFDWFVTQPYGVSISLAFAGLVVIERAGVIRYALAMILMILAHWVNLGVVFVIIPFVLVRRWHLVTSLSIATVGAVGGLVLKRLSTVVPTVTETTQVGEWIKGWVQLLRMVSRSIVHPDWIAICAVMAVAMAIVLIVYGHARHSIPSAALVMIVAVVHWLVIGALKHVQLNHYDPRYVLPSLMLVALAMAIVLLAIVTVRPSLVSWFTICALGAAIGVTYGTPSARRLNRTIDNKFGMITPEVLDVRATVIVGDYWTVWPEVFHANLAHRRRGAQTRVFGLTFRSESTDSLWLSESRAQRVTIAGSRSDKSVGQYFDRLGVPVTFVDYRGSLALFAVGTGEGAAPSGGHR